MSDVQFLSPKTLDEAVEALSNTNNNGKTKI